MQLLIDLYWKNNMCKSGFIIIVCNLLTNLLLNLIVLILYKFKFIISLWKINIYINNSTNVQKQPQSLKSLPSSWEPPHIQTSNRAAPPSPLLLLHHHAAKTTAQHDDKTRSGSVYFFFN
jgi:hypothetical protein